MNRDKCIHFLQWALPRMHMRWAGFRRVHRQVCKRIHRRMVELELENINQYKAYIKIHTTEWTQLDSLCRISISRFYRDRSVFDAFRTHIFPYICEYHDHSHEIHICSLGCCSGEEPYTIKMIWKYYVRSPLHLIITAVDNDRQLLRRAQKGIYKAGSIKDLPETLYQYFDRHENTFHLKKIIMDNIKFLNMDIRKKLPPGKFDIILCRNLVFTYYDEYMQNIILKELSGKISQRGLLITGTHEKLPAGTKLFRPFGTVKCVYKYV